MTINEKDFVFLADTGGVVGKDWVLESDASGEYITVAQTADNNKLALSSELSICTHIKYLSGEDSGSGAVIGKGSTLANLNYLIYMDAAGNLYFQTGDGTNNNIVNSSWSVTGATLKIVAVANSSYHYLYVYDGSDIYIDRAATSYTPFNTENTEDVTIFKHPFTANKVLYGAFLDAQIFDRSLTETEALCFLKGGDVSNPLWSFWASEQTGTALSDSSIIIGEEQSDGVATSMDWSGTGTEREGSRWL